MRYLLFFCACLAFGQITQGTGGNAVVPAAGVVKSNGTVLQTAAAGTDYQAPVPTCTGPLKSPGGTVACATSGTDYQPAFTSGSAFPVSACTNGNQYYRTDTGEWFICKLNAWRPYIYDTTYQAALNALGNAYRQTQRIVILGDSETRCYGATGDNTTSCPGVGPLNKTSMWAEQLRRLVSTRYGSHGSGMVTLSKGISGTPSTDTGYFTTTGSVTSFNFFGPVLGGTNGAMWAFPSGATITMSSQYATSFNVYYAIGSSTAPGFTAQIDGGTGTTVMAASGALSAAVANISAGSLGVHTLKLTSNGDTQFLYAIEAVSSPVGVAVDNISIGGIQASAWNVTGGTVYTDMLTNVPLVMIALGTNEHINSVSTATYQTNLSTMITHAQSQWPGCQVIVMLEPWDSTSSPSESGYYTAARAAATANGALILDPTNDLMPSYSFMTTNSLINVDGLHYNDAGHLMWGRWILDRIFGANTLR
jgi:hypothetical protein